MKIQYSNNVKNTLKEYANSLKKYPISKERRNQKVRQLKQFLRNTIKQTAENIGTFSYPVCRYEDLGQILDVNRNQKHYGKFLLCYWKTTEQYLSVV